MDFTILKARQQGCTIFKSVVHEKIQKGPFTYYVMVFFPIFDSPLPLCYTLLCFLKPPFTIMLLLDDPPPSNLVILVS